MICVCIFMTGAPEGSNESGSEEARNRICYPWFTRHSTYLLHHSSYNDEFILLNTINLGWVNCTYSWITC